MSEEADLKANKVNYIRIILTSYIKQPFQTKLHISYIDYIWSYTGDDFGFKYYSEYARINEYNIGKYKEMRKYTIQNNNEIEEKLVETIRR